MRRNAANSRLSSPANAGDPVTTAVICEIVTAPRGSRGMGPGLRRDDEELSPHHQRHPPDRLAVDQQPHRLRIIFQRQPVRDVGPDFAGLRPFQQLLRSAPRASAGFRRTASPARTPSTLAPLISSRLVRASPMPPVKPITSSRAPQAMQRMLFSKISPPTGSNTTSAPRPSVMRLTASRNGSRLIQHQMIGALRLRHRELFLRSRPPRSRSRPASCPSRPRQARRRRRRHAPAAPRPA